MRALIDESVEYAAGYYEIFPREPSLDPSLDIDVDNIVRIERMTATRLLDEMFAAGKSRERELLIVTQPGVIAKLADAPERLKPVRDLRFERLEFRACCVDHEADELAALRELLGAARLVAPSDRSIYCPVAIEILNGGVPRPLPWAGPVGTRRFGEPEFALSLQEDARHHCTGHGEAFSWEDVELFVRRNILFDSGYAGRRTFPLSAFRTCDDLGPDRAFLLPADPEYRERLRSDS